MNVDQSNADKMVIKIADSITNAFGFPPLKIQLSKLKEHFVVNCEQGKGKTGGPVLQVSIKDREMSDNIDRIILAFSDSGSLDAAWLIFTAEAYKDLERKLSSALQPASDAISPYKGKRAIFLYGDAEVAVSNPLFSDETTLTFMSKGFINMKESRNKTAIA